MEEIQQEEVKDNSRHNFICKLGMLVGGSAMISSIFFKENYNFMIFGVGVLIAGYFFIKASPDEEGNI